MLRFTPRFMMDRSANDVNTSCELRVCHLHQNGIWTHSSSACNHLIWLLTLGILGSFILHLLPYATSFVALCRTGTTP